jgi:hypothetical protein
MATFWQQRRTAQHMRTKNFQDFYETGKHTQIFLSLWFLSISLSKNTTPFQVRSNQPLTFLTTVLTTAEILPDIPRFYHSQGIPFGLYIYIYIIRAGDT